jgi:hypothetical protein
VPYRGHANRFLVLVSLPIPIAASLAALAALAAAKCELFVETNRRLLLFAALELDAGPI